MILLSELLNIKKLKMLNLVAGQTGISRNVSGAIMLDNPEMVNWMREGEILLTTGYLLKDNPIIQNQLITDLVKSNAGALVVKLKRYFDTIPRAMIEKANELDFPLLELPYYMSLSELSEIINKHIYFAEKDINDSESNISELLFELIRKNGNTKAILDLSESFTLDAFALLDINMKTRSISNNFSSYSNLTPVIGESLFSSTNTKTYIKQIDRDTDSLDIYLSLKNSATSAPAIIYPIRSEEELLGYLLSVSNANNLPTIRTNLIYKKIVLALSILLLKEKAYLAYKNHELDFSLERLLNNEALTTTEIEKVSKTHNLPLKSFYICCIVSFTKIREINSNSNWVGFKALKRDQIISYWNYYSKNSCKLFSKNNNIIILLPIENKSNDALELVRSFCHDIQLLLTKHGLEKDVLMGIGNISFGLTNLHYSFYQAQKTIEIMSKINNETIGTFDDYLLYELINNSAYIHDALKEKLLPLINYDHDHNTELLITLEAYMNNNQNSIQTAKSLFIHRNTLYYRLDKIIEILNIDFKNPDEIIVYQLAIKALSI